MKLELHPSAVNNFNEKADLLLLELVSKPKVSKQNSESSFKPDIFVNTLITEKDIIGEISISTVNSVGNKVAQYFYSGSSQIGLSEGSHNKLIRLSEEMQKIKVLFNTVSVNLITKLIFDWMRDRYKNITNLPMTEYVIDKCLKELKEFEIWMPIAMTHIQSEIKIGKIVLKTITRELIDQWCKEWQKDYPANKDKIQQIIDEKREKIQGFASATIKILAEPQRAYEIAFEEADKAISLLRIFSPANCTPQIISYCTLLGKENSETETYLITHGNKIYNISERVVDKASRSWFINNDFISIIKHSLEVIDNLLQQDIKNEFQEKVLDSLLLYSKSSLAKDPSDRLVYILVALESILLKNENEPIMQNVRERIAFFMGTSLSERKSIISRFNKAYSLRSKFIHHGHCIDDLKVLEEIMIDACTFFQQLVLTVNNFTTKEQFINKIEEIKLS